MTTPIAGVGVISPYGDLRALTEQVERPSSVVQSRVATLPKPGSRAEARARNQMSRSAILAAIALGRAIEDAGVSDVRHAAYYLGVGASGGAVDQLEAMLGASRGDDGRFDVRRFSTDGLRACNPMFAFQLMNNFTLCHGAILHGIGGPNGAIFSTGAGTAEALLEAQYALEHPECNVAFAGGADSAIHPVTRSELAASTTPSEAAAIVVLGGGASKIVLESVQIDLTQDELRLNDVGVVLCTPTSTMALIDPNYSGRLIDVSSVIAEALAATPALAWAIAIEYLRSGRYKRAVVLTRGGDDVLVAIRIARPTH